ncbi:hypothetical protein [Sphingobacterium anhuiense]
MYDDIEWADRILWNNYESTENETSIGRTGSITVDGNYTIAFYGN